MDEVCLELGVDVKPSSLVWHVHPLLMFQRKDAEVYKEIHSLPKPCLVAPVNDYFVLYKEEVSHLMSITLPKLAKGFSEQWSDIWLRTTS